MQAMRHNAMFATWLPVIGGAMLAVFGDSQIQLVGVVVWGTGVGLQVTLGANYLIPKFRGALVSRMLPGNANGLSEGHLSYLDEALLLQGFRQADPLLRKVILEGLSVVTRKAQNGLGTP